MIRTRSSSVLRFASSATDKRGRDDDDDEDTAEVATDESAEEAILL
jgi:hypothetical protein